MSAEAFWNSSPRAILALYACAKAARVPATAGTDSTAPATAPASAPERLARIPR